jgi:hypothetical protein
MTIAYTVTVNALFYKTIPYNSHSKYYSNCSSLEDHSLKLSDLLSLFIRQFFTTVTITVCLTVPNYKIIPFNSHSNIFSLQDHSLKISQ